MSAQTEELMDFSKITLERGPTPEDIEEKCLQLCQQYIGDVWLKLSTDDLKVQRLSGGLTNQIYYVAINKDKPINETKAPQEVVIRLYLPKYFNNLENQANERLSDTIIALVVSENGLGPKIYGLFEGGQIQKYYKHKCFEVEEQKEPKLVKEVAQRLARIHALDIPIKRTGNWIFDFFDDCYKKANERFDLKAIIEENKSETLKACDVGQELEWLKKAILDSKSPKTFTHVDYRESNILITESDGIILCDFEYSCYGHRGFDFGTLFCDWGRVYGNLNQIIEYPSDHTIGPFIDSYIEQSVKLKGKQFSEDKRNSFENILKEVKLFSLVAVMWIVMFHLQINQSLISAIPFNKLQSMQRVESHYQRYHKFKNMFIQQNILPNDGHNDHNQNCH